MLYAAVAVADNTPQTEPEAAIEFLLARVVSSDLQFVRNGKVHAPPEAVRHMRRKYEYYKNRIKTAEDFIALAATKSMISGKQYTIRSNAGEELAADWLNSALAEYRTAKNEAGEPGK
jgi:FPC/CPF motif-containing protein YcgG